MKHSKTLNVFEISYRNKIEKIYESYNMIDYGMISQILIGINYSVFIIFSRQLLIYGIAMVSLSAIYRLYDIVYIICI